MRWIVIALVAACGGGDDPPKPAAVQQAAAPVGSAPTAAGSGKPLPVVVKVEAQITDEDCLRVKENVPAEDAKKCEPRATKTIVIGDAGELKPDPTDLTCPDPKKPEAKYCLPTSKGYLCGKCPERDTIRDILKERDFVAETNRDPFESFLLKPPGTGPAPGEQTDRCKPDTKTQQGNIRAADYGYQDLKLVGIVAQGTQRKVLMMDGHSYGHIIKRGDCVGREKAWVKDIGENFICFELAQEPSIANVRTQDSVCVELHTKEVSVTSLPGTDPAPQQPTARPPTSVTPIVPPPPTLPHDAVPVAPAPVPAQPPTNLRP